MLVIVLLEAASESSGLKACLWSLGVCLALV